MGKAQLDLEVVATGFFAWRAPLLPFDALPRDAEQLRALYDRADVRDALYVASPALETRIPVWQNNPKSEAARKIEQSLLRYAARMAGRATPFGLFAGCSIGRIGSTTRLTVSDKCDRHTRLDMDYVVSLCSALSCDQSLKSTLRFSPNSSLYRVAGRARYLEVRPQEKGWSHHRVSLELPDYLEVVLARARDGATSAELAH